MSDNKTMKKGIKDLMKKGLGKKPGSGVKPKKLDLSMFDNLPKKAGGGMMKKKGMAAGGMTKKKGMARGGMTKKGMAAGGLTAAIKKVDQKKKGAAAGGMMKKKGMARGGMTKKGMARGGMTKKGMARGGMTKKGYKNGGKVRGVGIASKGFRPVKMVTMSKGGKKGGKKR